MKQISVDADNPSNESVEDIVKTLKEKRIIIYPTDTVYGIGSVVDELAINRIYTLKKRGGTPMSLAFSNTKEISHYTYVEDIQLEFIEKEKDNGTTFILKKKNIPDFVTCGLATIGVRIPDLELCKRIIELTGPIITTSANTSGNKAPYQFADIEVDILEGSDLCIDSGECKLKTPSRIYDLTTDEFRILRN